MSKLHPFFVILQDWKRHTHANLDGKKRSWQNKMIWFWCIECIHIMLLENIYDYWLRKDSPEMIAFKQASNLAFVDTLRCDSSSQKFSTVSGNDKFQRDLVVIFPPKKTTTIKPSQLLGHFGETFGLDVFCMKNLRPSTASTGQGEAPKDQRAEGCAFGEAPGLLGSEDLSFWPRDFRCLVLPFLVSWIRFRLCLRFCFLVMEMEQTWNEIQVLQTYGAQTTTDFWNYDDSDSFPPIRLIGSFRFLTLRQPQWSWVGFDGRMLWFKLARDWCERLNGKRKRLGSWKKVDVLW